MKRKTGLSGKPSLFGKPGLSGKRGLSAKAVAMVAFGCAAISG